MAEPSASNCLFNRIKQTTITSKTEAIDKVASAQLAQNACWFVTFNSLMKKESNWAARFDTRLSFINIKPSSRAILHAAAPDWTAKFNRLWPLYCSSHCKVVRTEQLLPNIQRKPIGIQRRKQRQLPWKCYFAVRTKGVKCRDARVLPGLSFCRSRSGSFDRDQM